MIVDFRPKLYERSIAASEAVLAELRTREAGETDRRVRQDLAILIKAVEDSIRSTQLNREHLLPYFNLSQTVFLGIRAIVDPQVSRDRYPAAVVRMQRYAGMLDAEKPLTELAKDLTRERFGVEGLAGPYRGEVVQDLERAESMIAGIEELMGRDRPGGLGRRLYETREPAPGL